MSIEAISWIAPDGETVTASKDTTDATQAWPESDEWPTGWPTSGGRFMLRGVQGTEPVPTTQVSREVPGGYGPVAYDRKVGGRTVSAQVLVKADTSAAVGTFVEQLSRVLADMPSRGSPVEFGWVRVFRPGKPTVQVRAQPVNSPQVATRHGGAAVTVDLEWAADPAWRWTTNESVTLEVGQGGYSFPLTFPFTIGEASDTAEIVNPGHLVAPMVVRFYGPQSWPKLERLDTGESMTIEGSVAAGEYVEVDTGRKTVVLVAADGSRTSIPHRRLFDSWTYWTLGKGTNPVRRSAATASVDARVEVIFTPLLAGV